MKTKVLVVTVLSAAIVFAQSKEAPVYVEQFQNLQASVDRIATDVSQTTRTPSNQDDVAKFRDTQARLLLALVKLVHRLDEEAAKADLESLKAGASADKRLQLVQVGCTELDVVIRALNSYLDTNDSFFLSIAADGKQIIASIKKVL